MMRRFAALTGLYSLSHFIVDFSCAYLIFSKVHGTEKWLLCMIIYNFCAFALQMPLGLIVDKMKRNRIFAVFGCAIVSLSAVFVSIPFLLCAVAGLGNALFHIGAGRSILCGSGKSFSALGIFISPGALGLYLGTICGKRGNLLLAAVLCALLADAVLLLFVIPLLEDRTEIRETNVNENKLFISGILFTLLCLFLVVCLRSYVSMTLAFPWKKEGYYAVYLVFAVVCGKAFGGILADRFGPLKVSFLSLFLGAVLFLFYRTPMSGITAVLLFNMTMPITLGAVARVMPNLLGFGFGILTFGLFIGLIPVLLGTRSLLILPYGYTAVCIISACLLYYGLKAPRKELTKNAH